MKFVSMVVIQNVPWTHWKSCCGKKTFKCENCDVSFSSRQNMDRHIATVHEGKKLRLSLLEKSTINKHIKSVHEEKKATQMWDLLI